MRLVYTEDALSDLESACAFISQKWPDILEMFDDRLTEIERTILEHPLSGHEVPQRPGIKSFAFVHYPYVLFYRIKQTHLEVLRIYNTSQRPWQSDNQ
jgi:addiction module RelE/StbE family toxin